MTGRPPQPDPTMRLRWPLRATWAGLLAERLTRAFWPVWTVLLAVIAGLALGLPQTLAPRVAMAGMVGAGAAGLVALGWGLWRFRWPRMSEACARLDAALPGRPLAALADRQEAGADDVGAQAVWHAHLVRMTGRLAQARAVPPDLRLSRADPFALRYVALTAFLVAAVFGSLWRVGTAADLVSGETAARSAWEGWVEPPAYTRRPTIYLNDSPGSALDLPRGSRVSLRLYGDPGALILRETVSGRGEVAETFVVVRAGEVAIKGRGGRTWQVGLLPDLPPEIRLDGPPEVRANGEMRQRFTALDDYGVVSAQARITLDMPAVERIHGLVPPPDPRPSLILDLPMPVSGSRDAFTETLVENLSQHPWAGLPVQVVLTAQDAAGQGGQSMPQAMVLSGRRFFDPLARAVAEQRRDLLWTRVNGRRVVQVLRALSHRPEEIFRDDSTYLQLRVALRRLDAAVHEGLTAEVQDEIAAALWKIALEIELGDLSDAEQRLHRAQDRLSEAIRNGASDAEIAELMQELREALRDYARQLAERADPDTQRAETPPGQEITGEQMQQMMDQLQRLMEEGRMAEAEQLLNQLRQMMENLRVTQNPGGGEPPGRQAMEGLGQTLRGQQELSDDAFGQLQNRFGPGAQSGDPEGLAERQRGLRRELDEQMHNLPGLGESDGAREMREALDRAGRAMDDAERALRDDDLAGALDRQAEVLEALREGMRNLDQALAQAESGEGGPQAGAPGRAERDPLGREGGGRGQIGTSREMLREDIAPGNRARALQEEIRRRSGERERSETERDYLERLLERF
ncbi:uncharacterized protein (TIGR02302 family) [Rhodovulum imhoffii]|uniref:Uncharacterized protein (TIGR02302 family) n=1 Tax=Rhodovulum imhoffii TaxID=365340 RepID=A0A2T5BUM8_9RHOB|nr:DUF4175 domain-containing protein [Rhodovulum imhoffii]MBK5934823.1 hypothetical protein [Rhodovulum imhoffii]PTN03224.1 uncharacterized protein (TIGR02302 family) [Rhodovulum imhoffii]